jgi:hypothetical protein
MKITVETGICPRIPDIFVKRLEALDDDGHLEEALYAVRLYVGHK